MASRSLQVWLDDVHVADVERRGREDLRCRYTPEALRRWPLNSPVISCSLPLVGRPLRADAFLRGLLPEGHALEALAARADVPASDTFSLLARYGRDIAGALIFSEGPPSPERFAVERYSDQTLVEEVAALESRPLGVHDDSELSIAGLQNKMLLVRLADGAWARPLHGQPSTHILKRDSASRPGLVEAEAHCLGLARKLGLTDIDPELVDIGALRCIIVSRFDRRLEAGGVRRVHQEDLCQATGRQEKYQSRGRGGPGLTDAARLLDSYAARPEDQLRRLLAATTFAVAIGDADAHGKNRSLLHEDPSTIALAPLYDTVPTIMWPSLRTDAAMSINGRFSLITCDTTDLVREAQDWPLATAAARSVVRETLERLNDAISETLPERAALTRTLAARVSNLLSGATAGPPAEPFHERRG